MTEITKEFIAGEIAHLENELKKNTDNGVMISGAIQAYRIVAAKLDVDDSVKGNEPVKATKLKKAK